MAAGFYFGRRALRSARHVSFGLALCTCLLLVGCKNELYSDLPEDDANQMMAILMANDIPTDKSEVGKSGFSLSVDQDDMLRAIAVLKDAGFPKVKYETIGQEFQPSGLISSPFEERVRYVYALGEDVAQTLSRIDGVVTARVHIVLPESPDLGQPIKPSSAAVFIKHVPGVDLDYFIPQIKRLVSSSIEGLDYSAVTVVLAEAEPMKATPLPERRGTIEVLPGVSISQEDQSRFWEWILAAGALVIFLIGSNIAVLYFWRGSSWFKPKAQEASSESAIEPS